MKRTVSVSPAARQDIERLANFFAGDPDRMLGITDLLRSAAGSLRDFAERGLPGRRPGYRELFVPFQRSAYVIQYVVEHRTVTITRIFHGLEDRPLA